MRDRDEILDRDGIEHLPAETLGRDAGTDALACGIDRRRRARRAAADDENVERFLIGEFRRRLGLGAGRSEEHTSELQSLMRISYAVFRLKTKKNNNKSHEKTEKKT